MRQRAVVKTHLKQLGWWVLVDQISQTGDLATSVLLNTPGKEYANSEHPTITCIKVEMIGAKRMGFDFQRKQNLLDSGMAYLDLDVPLDCIQVVHASAVVQLVKHDHLRCMHAAYSTLCPHLLLLHHSIQTKCITGDTGYAMAGCI